MKKIIPIIFILIFSLLLTGCPPPPPSENHPLLQDNAKWVCDNLDMYFEVNLNDKEVSNNAFPGIINKDGVITEIRAYISGGSSICFSTHEETDSGTYTGVYIYFGQCKLKNDILIIKTTQPYENSFIDASIKELVFTKHNLEDEPGY